MTKFEKITFFYLAAIIPIFVIGFWAGMNECKKIPISERMTACEEKGGKYQLLYSVNTGYNESCIAPEVLIENRFLDF